MYVASLSRIDLYTIQRFKFKFNMFSLQSADMLYFYRNQTSDYQLCMDSGILHMLIVAGFVNKLFCQLRCDHIYRNVKI